MKCRNSGFANYGLSGESSRWGLPLRRFLVLLVAVWLMAGKMPAWSQDSEPKSNNSSETSQPFDLSLAMLNKLHNQASSQLTELTQSLKQASQELQTSKTQLTRLQNLLNDALQRLTDLESTNQRISKFNEQIGERMQEQNEDLANAYGELDAQDKKVLKMWTAIIVLGLGCLGFIIFGIIKLRIKV